MSDYRIGSIMPAIGYQAWGCRFEYGVPVVEKLLVTCLAVVQYDEGDRVEPLIEDGAYYPSPLNEVLRVKFQDHVVLLNPGEKFDEASKQFLISQAEFNLRQMLKECEEFLQNPQALPCSELRLHHLSGYMTRNFITYSLEETIGWVEGLQYGICGQLGLPEPEPAMSDMISRAVNRMRKRRAEQTKVVEVEK